MIEVAVQRLVRAILEAWRAAERQLAHEPPGTEEAARLVERAEILRQAHALAIAAYGERDPVARFLEEHGAGDVIPLGAPRDARDGEGLPS
jgi:hypothetical protein